MTSPNSLRSHHEPADADAFTWPYVASGTAQDIGLDAAWQLLADIGAFGGKAPGWAHRVNIMVVDQGFRLNDDLPEYRKIRRAEWGEPSRPSYGDSRWHGELVANALLGKVDNGFGGAGPAGPLDPGLIAVGDARPSSWSNVRSLVRLVAGHRPDIVNMSYVVTITSNRPAYQNFYERKFSDIKHDYGALPFASAGNDSRDLDYQRPGALLEKRLVLPCEAKHVVCVGGMGKDTTARAVGDCGDAQGSNYGTETGGRSVELWGPYFVRSQSGPADNPGLYCGTSFASPFVAGVAALVMAADPSLHPDGVLNVLKDTAHEGGIGPEVTGTQKRVNAGSAARRAYGKDVDPPEVAITSPRDGDTFHVGEWVDLAADARDHLDRTDLTLSWTSGKDGQIAGPTTSDTFTESLSAGKHAILVTATDRLGQTASDIVVIHVTERPITVDITSPGEGDQVATTDELVLAGEAGDKNRPLDSIADALLHWTVAPASAPDQPLFTGNGGLTMVPAGTLPPGSYRARLAVAAGARETTDEVTFTVAEPDPGVPSIQLLEPLPGSAYPTRTGSVELTLRASATDSSGQPMSGTRLRWVARNGDQEQVLCAGTDTPHRAPVGGDPVVRSCQDVTATLDVPAGKSSWSITVEAHQSSGPTGSAERGVIITYTPPPVP